MKGTDFIIASFTEFSGPMLAFILEVDGFFFRFLTDYLLIQKNFFVIPLILLHRLGAFHMRLKWDESFRGRRRRCFIDFWNRINQPLWDLEIGECHENLLEFHMGISNPFFNFPPRDRRFSRRVIEL